MTGSASKKLGNRDSLFAYCWQLFESLHEVSGSITELRKYVFVKLMYVTICDLHGHRRSQVVVGTERLYRAPNYK